MTRGAGAAVAERLSLQGNPALREDWSDSARRQPLRLRNRLRPHGSPVRGRTSPGTVRSAPNCRQCASERLQLANAPGAGRNQIRSGGRLAAQRQSIPRLDRACSSSSLGASCCWLTSAFTGRRSTRWHSCGRSVLIALGCGLLLRYSRAQLAGGLVVAVTLGSSGSASAIAGGASAGPRSVARNGAGTKAVTTNGSSGPALADGRATELRQPHARQPARQRLEVLSAWV